MSQKINILFSTLILYLFFLSNPSYAKPVIEWTPSKISFEQTQGSQSSQVISVKFSKDAHGVVARVVPELQKWVAVSPSSIGNVLKGEVFDITITINISLDDPIGTFDGVIQLRQLIAGKQEKTIAKPIPVVLKITQSEDPAVLLENLSNDVGGLSDNVELPAVPDNEIAKLSITGVDYNNNGIRDELENIVFQGLNTLPSINIDSYNQLIAIIDMIQPKSPIVENSINEHNIYCSYRLLSEDVKTELPLSLLYSIVLDTQERRNAFNSSIEESVVSLGAESCE